MKNQEINPILQKVSSKDLSYRDSINICLGMAQEGNE